MERKLSQHDDRPGWQNENFEYLLIRLMEEQGELNNLMMDLGELSELSSDADIQDVINEATDVGNFAMMIADNARRFIKDN
jgi:NTP pyrophosphatase (non-canonical NTP hydrolase)